MARVLIYPSLDRLEAVDFVVCVEVLQPSQPNEVMLSAVSVPNHTFTGGCRRHMQSSKTLISLHGCAG